MKQMKRQHIKVIQVILLAIGTLLLSACTTVDKSNAIPLSTGLVSSGDMQSVTAKAKRYAWHPQLSQVKSHPKLTAETVLANSKRLINRDLAKKGYQLVSADSNPDFYVGFGLAMASSMDDDQILSKAGLVAGLSSSTSNQKADEQRFEKGSLFIALFKGLHRQPSWRVLFQGYADFERGKSEQKQHYQATITRMLRPIPMVGQ